MYEDTSKDLVVFPRQFDVPAGGKRIVRVGIEGAPPAAEAAYRVFIEELPPAASASQGRKGTVAVIGRFALPVFIVPAGAKSKLAIDSVTAKGGTYSAKLSNAGASRVRMAHVVAGAKDTGSDAHQSLPACGREPRCFRAARHGMQGGRHGEGCRHRGRGPEGGKGSGPPAGCVSQLSAASRHCS